MVEIRSFRRVFDLERRIYRIDSIRLNPAGIPVRGVLYFLGALAGAQLVAVLPVPGPFFRLVPWYLRSLALPGAIAVLLGLVRVEGRHFHLAAYALGRFAFTRHAASRRCRASTWRPSQIVFLPDGSDAEMRALRYTGPGVMVVRTPHRRRHRSSRPRYRRLRTPRGRDGLILNAHPDGPPRSVAIEVAPGGRVRTTGRVA